MHSSSQTSASAATNAVKSNSAQLNYQHSAVMESSRTCSWPRGSSRTISIVLGLGLGLVGHVLDSITDIQCIILSALFIISDVTQHSFATST